MHKVSGLRVRPSGQLAVDYGKKRDMLCDALTAAGLIPSVPEGAYYVLADATLVPGDEARGKARALLAHTGVAFVSGSAFYGEERAITCCASSSSFEIRRQRPRTCK